MHLRYHARTDAQVYTKGGLAHTRPNYAVHFEQGSAAIRLLQQLQLAFFYLLSSVSHSTSNNTADVMQLLLKGNCIS